MAMDQHFNIFQFIYLLRNDQVFHAVFTTVCSIDEGFYDFKINQIRFLTSSVNFFTVKKKLMKTQEQTELESFFWKQAGKFL